MKKSDIKEFLKEWCDRVVDLEMPDHMWELLMDDHKGIKWGGVEYIIPENCSMWEPEEEEIANYLMDNFAL